ncbi:hypothetical protein, partial [Ralstonia solanacearum]|uniref:hypothetical protein n=1 Tax=Ralstonia solanacearum TaxID=305 RepID=UPI001E50FDD8
SAFRLPHPILFCDGGDSMVSPLKIDRPCRTVTGRQRRVAMVSGFGRRGLAPQSESKGEWLGQINGNPGCDPPSAGTSLVNRACEFC